MSGPLPKVGDSAGGCDLEEDAMARLVRFYRTDRQENWVNPLLVRHVRPYGINGRFSEICFTNPDDEEGLIVEGSPSDVASRLSDALIPPLMD